MNEEPSFMDFHEAFQRLTYQDAEDCINKLEKYAEEPNKDKSEDVQRLMSKLFHKER